MCSQELLQKCVNKDRCAWDEFSKLYRGLVTRSVRYKLGGMGVRLPKSDIEDIVQDIFLGLWDKDSLSQIRKPSSLKGWLAIVSINATSRYVQKNIFGKERKIMSLDEVSEGTISSSSSLFDSEREKSDRLIESGELKKILEEEISHLEERQKLALKFHIYDEKSYKDIARIMNLPLGTVATLIDRGKKRLKRSLSYMKKV